MKAQSALFLQTEQEIINPSDDAPLPISCLTSHRRIHSARPSHSDLSSNACFCTARSESSPWVMFSPRKATSNLWLKGTVSSLSRSTI